jgi:hypothetical protein
VFPKLRKQDNVLIGAANAAIVPLAVFACTFAWFIIEKRVDGKYDFNHFDDFEALAIWMFWCSMPITILVIAYLDSVYRQNKSLPFLLAPQLFLTIYYFYQALYVGSSPMAPMVILIPMFLWFFAMPFFVYITFRFFVFDTPDYSVPEVVADVNAISRQESRYFLLRVLVWSGVAISLSVMFILFPFVFRPSIDFFRRIFGL